MYVYSAAHHCYIHLCNAVEGVMELEPNPCYSAVHVQANSIYEPISGKDGILMN